METMEDGARGPLALELIRKRKLTPRQADILQLFSYEDPDEAAFHIDFFCPLLTEREEATNYLWDVWEVMTEVARSPHATSVMHAHLVRIIQGLGRIAKGEMVVWNAERRVWGDLPLFPEYMEKSDSCPLEDDYYEELTPERALMWLNLSSFAARCMGAGVLGPYVQVIRALEIGLEMELYIGGEQDLLRTECKILVACEWMAHGARPLLRWAQENIGYEDLANDPTQHFPSGPLYTGPPAVCLQRWSFWQRRFEELGRGDVVPGLGDDVRKAALEAAETMDVVERRVANTLSDISY